ncbi:MAG: hypothetical protein M5U01_28705 [Ardenticatenaceae bacterium]|nr:hypothetical protein [Ardenticatenaceae bacterium]HBY96475.1 hypothetical protein [Chloroflexota bacterium]
MMASDELQDFASEVQTERATRAEWITNLGYLLVLIGLVYFIGTARDGGLDGPNRVFWGLLAFWLAYTPVAARKKWFVIRL